METVVTWLEIPRSVTTYFRLSVTTFNGNNEISEQIDLVIYDRQYSPFVYHEKGACYIPAESVYAVFEVKQELSKDTFEYAANKIKSVRLLTRTSTHITHAEGKVSTPKEPLRILGGILTTSASWKDPFGEAFQDCINNVDLNSQIDIGCIIDTAGFIVKYEGTTTFEKSTKDEALIYFFLRLFNQLQSLGTVPAMDVNAYARALDSI